MKKTFIAIVAVIITSASIFWACSKDSENEENTKINMSNNSFFKKKIIVGTLSINKNGEQTINPTFDKDNYLQKLEQILSTNSTDGVKYVAEDVETYINEDGLPLLRVAIFDITNDKSNNLSFKLEKISSDKNATTGYAIAGTGSSGNLAVVCKNTVTCVGTNCDVYDNGKLFSVGCRLKTTIIDGESVDYCSYCAIGGTCTRTETSEKMVKSICKAF